MAVTAKDIAKELKLSQPTVSRILSGDTRHRVAEATRQRVVEAAARHNYRPNALARSLRKGRTKLIGLYTNHDYDARNDFLGTLIGSLQRACEAEGLDLLLHSAFREASPHEIYGKLRDGRIDGLVLHAGIGDPLSELLGNSSLPVVAVADSHPDLPSVVCDDIGGIKLLVQCLIQKGYQRFAFLCPQESLGSVERRRTAFEAEMRRWNISPENYRVISIFSEYPSGALDLLLEWPGQTAVCCWNDRTAYKLLQLCDERGLPIPQRMAVTGFDGFLSDKAPKWRLTTIRCPWSEAAATSLALLNELIAGNEVVAETILPVDLLEGNTI